VPEPGNPQALNRYGYVHNNPLRYVDAAGHFPIVPLLVAGALVVLKVIDYGWTAWDAYQGLRVVQDPRADPEAKAAAANLVLIAATEAAEPDELFPVALPLDDLARKGILKVGQEIGQEIGEKVVQEASEEIVQQVARGGTYKLVDPETGKVVYVGRTSNLARRAAEHQRDATKSRFRFEIDWVTDDYAVQRGREEMLYEHYRPMLNRIRPISLRNPNRERYLEAARRFEERMREVS